MMPSDTNAIHGTCQLSPAGRIEIKAIEIPASAPSIAARGVYLRIVGPTNAPSRMMMCPGEARLPGKDRVARLQVRRQHDKKDDDKHVRNGRSVRQGGDVVAALALAEPPSEPRIKQIADSATYAFPASLDGGSSGSNLFPMSKRDAVAARLAFTMTAIIGLPRSCDSCPRRSPA
jgi:hypothetical protein